MKDNRMKNIMNRINKKKLISLSVLLAVFFVILLAGACKKKSQSEETKRIQEMTKIAAETQAETEKQNKKETEAEMETQTQELATEELTTEEFTTEELTTEEILARETQAALQEQIETEVVTQIETEFSTESETEAVQRNRLLTSEVIPYDGLPRKITCWGDSLTEGYGTLETITLGGIAGPTMPSTLSAMTGIEVFNMGIYGELSRDIACRQGGLKMYVNNILIPATGSVEISKIMCEDGNELTFGDQRDGNGLAWHAGFDACTIGGITGRLDYNDGTYIFTRAEAGEALLIKEDTPIVTPQSVERRNDILVIQMGNNGGWDEDTNVLISQYDAMILHSDYRYYIIIGDTDFEADLESDYEWEAALQEAYGNHFLNMREYLSDINRFSDCGISPESDDYYRLSIGEVPLSFKCDDFTHLNSYGYWLEGIAVYKKGQELGYWN